MGTLSGGLVARLGAGLAGGPGGDEGEENGRAVRPEEFVRRLRIYPHAIREANRVAHFYPATTRLRPLCLAR